MTEAETINREAIKDFHELLVTKGPQDTVQLRHSPAQKNKRRYFPGGPVVKTSPSNARGVGLVPNGGAKFLHALRPKKPKC